MNTKFFSSTDEMIIRVCIDSRPNGGIAGRIVAPKLASSCTFADAGELLLNIEAYLDAIGKPQAFQRGRTFGGRKRTVDLSERPDAAAAAAARGEIATCAIRITTRQNATWQGYADFGGEEGASFFASALELIFLLDSAIGE